MKKILGALLTIVLLTIGVAHAALIDRGGGLIYDDVLNITWMQDANYAKTSGYSASGMMTWDDAITWAAGLSYGGYTDWRLPSALNPDGSGPCDGFYCTGSELGELFYIEGKLSANQRIIDSLLLTGIFTNMKSPDYWFEDEYVVGANYVWSFTVYNGSQNITSEYSIPTYAWAVRDGDVNTAAIPEPGSLRLMGLSLLLLTFVVRSKNTR